jgi:N-formylglutamate deformylase
MSYSVFNAFPRIPLVANVPHSSDLIPVDVRDQFTVSDADLHEQNRQLVDWFTDELYAPIVTAGGCMVRHEVSRFVLDPERFEDDAQEIMAERGMGAIYTHGCQRQRIRRDLSSAERERVLSTYYRPYHGELIRQTESCLERFGQCVVIDCHSYPESPLPYELFGDTERPDVVLGTDAHHTPDSVARVIERIAREFGYSFGLNKPFAGTYVPLPYYKDSRVVAFMLEINRATYMNEALSQKSEGFEKTRSCVAAMVAALVGQVAESSRTNV